MSVKGAEGPIQARDRQCRAESRADGVSRYAAAEVRWAHSGGERQPGKWFEFVVDEKSFQSSGTAIALGKRRSASAVVEDNAEELAVILMKAIETRLQIVFRHIGTETDLPAGKSRGVVISRREINIDRRTVVVGNVAMIEGRACQQHFGIERVDPREINQCIGFVVAVAKIEGRVLPSQLVIHQIVFEVVRKRIVRDLVIILARRGHQTQLIGRIDVKNQRSEPAVSISPIVHYFRNGRLQSEIAAVAVDASVVREALGVTTEAERVIGLVKVAGTQNQFGLVVPFKAGA